jgi:hypothetical protein
LARDPRSLGVAVRRLVVWRKGRPTVIESNDLGLIEGFHDYETDNGFRWTNGNALLPVALCGGGITNLELNIAATTQYPLFNEPISAVA